jgi:16S rRNA (guanine966-N2)-methyltransferase
MLWSLSSPIFCSLSLPVVRYIQMRISGGTAKGRKTASKKLFTKTLAGERIRPTSSKVREALFDILQRRIGGARFVDIYAGTGTVGLEALSRGAGYAYFVEPNELLVAMIKKALQDVGFIEKAAVLKGRADEFLLKAALRNERFDIFFIDPPYQSSEVETVLPFIGEKGLLKENGLVIVEHFFKKQIPDKAGSLRMARTYRYGDTMLTMYTL